MPSFGNIGARPGGSVPWAALGQRIGAMSTGKKLGLLAAPAAAAAAGAGAYHGYRPAARALTEPFADEFAGHLARKIPEKAGPAIEQTVGNVDQRMIDYFHALETGAGTPPTAAPAPAADGSPPPRPATLQEAMDRALVAQRNRAGKELTSGLPQMLGQRAADYVDANPWAMGLGAVGAGGLAGLLGAGRKRRMKGLGQGALAGLGAVGGYAAAPHLAQALGVEGNPYHHLLGAGAGALLGGGLGALLPEGGSQ